jgi:hypothetical protein
VSTQYRLTQFVGFWHTFQYTEDNVIQAIEARGFKYLGKAEAVDIELQNQPIFEGLLGPTYLVTDKGPIIHYEDADNWKNKDNW